MTREPEDRINEVADQIASEGMIVRASRVREGAVEISRQRHEIERLTGLYKEAVAQEWRVLQEARAEVERLKAAHDGYVVAANANVCALYRDIERLKAENGRMRAHLGEAFCISFMDPKP